MLQEHEIFSSLRDNFRLCGERCDAIARFGALGGGWMEISRALDQIEGALRQAGHWRGDARWLRLAPLYVKAKDVGRTLYLTNQWDAFRKFGLIFAHGLARVEEMQTKATGRSGPILPTRPDPPKESVH